MMNDCGSLQGKVFLVTGASSGIGSACAEVLAAIGAQVVLVARNIDALARLRQTLPGTGHVTFPFDLNEADKIPDLLHQVVDQVGLLDGLVHAAGVHMLSPLRMLSAAKIEEIFKINVTSGLILTKGFRQKYISKRPGSIVFISSVAAKVGQPAISAYAMTKGAICAAAKSLAVELAAEQIRVNCVLPGIVKTALSEQLFSKMSIEQVEQIQKAHPLGFGEPVDVANAVAFLLSDAAKWITGIDLVVDGGYTAI